MSWENVDCLILHRGKKSLARSSASPGQDNIKLELYSIIYTYVLSILETKFGTNHFVMFIN